MLNSLYPKHEYGAATEHNAPMFLVDHRAQKVARGLLPDHIQMKVLGESGVSAPFHTNGNPVLGAISLTGQSAELKSALSGSPLARLSIVEIDPDKPHANSGLLMQVVLEALHAARQQLGEARLVAAQLRNESMGVNTRLREIENLLYNLGNPQLSHALAWQPTGRMISLASGQSLSQALPLNAVSLTAVDLWFPEAVVPVIADLAVLIEDAAGQAFPMQVASPDLGLETGWLRFYTAEPISGIGRDCRLRIDWAGKRPIVLGLGQAVPDPRFAVSLWQGKTMAQTQDDTLALRVWHSLGGVRLPACAPAFPMGHAAPAHEARFVPASGLPRPELFWAPPQAHDHVSTAFWENEDAVLVHPSRTGAACAIIRDVDLADLSHISALVTVGHVRAPSLNFAIGVAPHGAVDEDGFWQRRMGPWVTGLPARGWAQAHCIPVDPITGRADLLLAVSLAADAPNDLSWGLFRGFRISRGARSDQGHA